MAIDFACNTVTVDELLTCSFNLTKGELLIFTYFMNNPKSLTIKEIGSAVSMERSGAQKAVKKLVDAGLLEKRQVNNERGGFYYRYYIADKEDIKKRILELIDSWSSKAKNAVHNI
ncbi:MAG: MarR family transcriptional regulator [Candidatus Woesearchaeota archaeon]